MTNNIGTVDRIARILIGLALIVAPLLNLPAIWSNSVLSYGVIGIGVILMATAMVRFCPLYRLLGVNTCGI